MSMCSCTCAICCPPNQSIQDKIVKTPANPTDVQDFEIPPLHRHMQYHPKRFFTCEGTADTAIVSDLERYQVMVDVTEFPEDRLRVAIHDGFIVVSCENVETMNGHATLAKQLKRKWRIPELVDRASLCAILTQDHTLTIVGRKNHDQIKLKECDRVVPIYFKSRHGMRLKWDQEGMELETLGIEGHVQEKADASRAGRERWEHEREERNYEQSLDKSTLFTVLGFHKIRPEESGCLKARMGDSLVGPDCKDLKVKKKFTT